MTKTSWVIMRNTTCTRFTDLPNPYMIGFSSKEEAIKECDRLNEKTVHLDYYIRSVKVFQPTQEDNQ